MQQPARFSPYQPQFGCLLLLAVLAWILLSAVFLVDAAQLALTKLHLRPSAALLILLAIFFGGFVNLPVHVLEREVESPVPMHPIYTMMGWVPVMRRRWSRTIIAVNVGGCLIPAALAVFEAAWVWRAAPHAMWALVAATLANVAVCYYVARPVPGVGIAMPAFASPLVSVAASWLLLMPGEFLLIRAPVAFVAGVLGTLIGADLLHWREVTKLAAPIVSIGGAGTFDGIVLAGLLALAQHPRAVLTGVDRSPRAIALALSNAERHGLAARCVFEARDAEEASPDWDAVLVNPPRSGCHPPVLDALARSPARRLVYLSCNAETLARDLDHLGWPTTSIQPADMFPQTPHLELLALAERP